MKTAIFVYGQYRDFDVVVKSWNFLNNLDCDVYFSTWDKSHQENPALNYYIEKDVTEDMILKYVPNAKISILNEKNHYGNKLLQTSNPEKMIFHFKKCLEMSKESNIKYDFIMLTRTDNFIKCNFPSENFYLMNKKDRIYGTNSVELCGPKKFFVMDIFFWGDYDVMSNFINTLKDNTKDIHNGLAEHIFESNLFVESTSDKIFIASVRGNIKELNEEEQLIQELVFLKTIDWNDSLFKYTRKLENIENNT
jgi:hypothetical protein